MQKNPSYQHERPSGKKCVENDGPVGAILTTIIKEDCEKLKVLVGSLTEVERARRGQRRINESKRCCLVETETNYQVYRNLHLGIGVELIQATVEIKTDVSSYVALNEKLAAKLKELVTALKAAKEKFKELKKAGDDLDTCRKDKCSCTQMTILTGDPPQGCGDEKPRKPACEDTNKILHWLINRPEGFLHDINTALSSAADVAGIQTFMNIKSLEKFNDGMKTSADSFDGFIKEKMTKGAEDLKTCQAEFEASVIELTKAEYVVYRKRNEADGEKETIEFLCCHKCECIIETGDDADCKDRLKQCKKWICDICQEVDNIYCDYPDYDGGHHQHEQEQENAY